MSTSQAFESKTTEVEVAHAGIKLDMVELFLESEKKGDGVWAPQKDAVAVRVQQAIQVQGKGPGVGVSILDIGCGVGVDLRRWASKLETAVAVVSYQGCDIMSAVVEAATERTLGPVGCVYKHGDIHALPYDTDQFNVVHCSRVLIHSKDVIAAVDEMTRVLKPGGTAMACEGDTAPSTPGTQNPLVDKIMRAQLDGISSRVANSRPAFTAFWHLKKLEQEGKVCNVTMEVDTVVITDYNDIDPDFKMVEGQTTKMVQDGAINEDERADYLAVLRSSRITGDPIVPVPIYVVKWSK